MNWLYVAIAVLAALAFVAGLWTLFSRPTGPRIVRYARKHMASHPADTETDLRHALRMRFLGGVSPEADPLSAAENWLAEKLLLVVEAFRDYFFPIDRSAIAARIEAAVQIVLAPSTPPAPAGQKQNQAPPSGPRLPPSSPAQS